MSANVGAIFSLSRDLKRVRDVETQKNADHHTFLNMIRVAGIFPFGRDFELSYTLLVYSFGVLGLMMWGVSGYVLGELEEEETGIGEATIRAGAIIMDVTAMVCLGGVIYRRRQLAELGRGLQLLGHTQIHPSFRLHTLATLVSLVVIILLEALFTTNSFGRYRLAWFYVSMPSWLFAAALQPLRSEAALLGLDVARYLQLRRLCRLANDVFSVQLLCFLMAVFFEIVTDAHFLALTIKDCAKDSMTICMTDIIVTSLPLLMRLIDFFLIPHECQAIITKAKQFHNDLYRKILEDRTNQLLYNKELQLHLSIKRKIVFTACGFFHLDYTIIYSMVGAATTYLVILIQLGPSTSDTALLSNTTRGHDNSSV